MGEPVCKGGIMKLLGVGKHRFQRLYLAATEGKEAAPLDGRYIPKGPQALSEKKSKVFDFLQGLYKTAAESLPDGNHRAASRRPRQGNRKFDDKDMDPCGIRHLPPGKIMDYLRLCRAELPDEKVSAKLFNSAWRSDPSIRFEKCSHAEVWMEHFGDKLRIRSSTHHSKCSVCVRHRLIIKRVGRGPARTSQLQLYQQHLRRQYRDRQQYWQCRAVSRLQASSGEPVSRVSMILDSMDQAKHCYPRSESMGSKEFQQFYKPKMMNTSVIIHGHAVLVGLSPSNVPGNSSRAAELLAYSMTKSVELGINWSTCFLDLEADNCAKEVKNQTVLRMLGGLTCQHKLAGCQLSFLSSGHSHEDIDAMFSQVASHLTSHRELWTVEDFQQCIQDFFRNPMVRKHEPFREVVLFDQFRDWTLGYVLSSGFRLGQ